MSRVSTFAHAEALPLVGICPFPGI